jgi:hypothetical protein
VADFEVGTLTPEQCRLLWQWYQQSTQLSPQLTKNYPQRREIDEPSPHRIFVRNDSGEVIPAYGCMEVFGTDTVAGRAVLKVRKPSANGCADKYLFNSQYKIPTNENGWGFAWGLVRMLGEFVESGDYCNLCARYEPQPNSWEIAVASGPYGNGPFIVFGNDDTIPGTVIGRVDPKPAHLAKHIKVTKSGGSWIIDDWYDGEDPTECNVDIECLFDCSCMENGDQASGFYDPNSNKYLLNSTASALMGEGTLQTFVTHMEFDGCALNYTRGTHRTFCYETAALQVATMDTTEVRVLIPTPYINANNTALLFPTINVLVCGTVPDYDVSLPLAECPEPECQDSECTYTWYFDEGTSGPGDWTLTTPCPTIEGCTCTGPPLLPGTTNGETQSFPCSGA